MLRSCDVMPFSSAESSGFNLRLRHDKANLYNNGPFVRIHARPGDRICPVNAVQLYIDNEPALSDPNAPFFVIPNSDGTVRPLTDADINAALQKHASEAGLDPSLISTHSERIGGAFHLADNGVKLESIQIRGRWSPKGWNAVVLSYMRTSARRELEVSEAMSRPASAPLGPNWSQSWHSRLRHSDSDTHNQRDSRIHTPSLHVRPAHSKH